MSIRASYSVENVLHYSIPVSNHLLNKAFKLLRYLSLYYLTEAYLKFKDGASFCYCAYVLRISGYSGFLRNLSTNTTIFLRGL